MFAKVLIANRGEIAVRIARTARSMGIASVAVYSDADRDAQHVKACDQAFYIGTAPASESYLGADRIIQVALDSGAEAIHPGYGFLSENAGFARACEQAGLVFIGPPADAIEAMGSKREAKRLIGAAGVPMVAGYHGDDQSDAALNAASRELGYPQLIKASSGGGGKGMRAVHSAAEFKQALQSARREAMASFGDDAMLIERLLIAPRHVELQIFADQQGNCIHLFERDCSIQRRHQKILEEAPAPGVSAALRERMGQSAIACATAIGYRGAGTVEFLLDSAGNFYFMEMNTRLQVEHPVSEMISGQDLVEWQLRIADGEPLPLTQKQLSISGHALEARIYAESPERDFMPASGCISWLSLPAENNRLRIDCGVSRGDSVGIYYDPMIAKLIVHGTDRDDALARMRLALRAFEVLGLQTNIGFISRLIELDAYVAAQLDTGFIERHREVLFAVDTDTRNKVVMLAAAALIPAMPGRVAQANQAELQDGSPWSLKNSWRLNQAAQQRIRLRQDETLHEVLLTALEQGWRLEFDGHRAVVQGSWLNASQLRIEINGEILILAVVIDAAQVSINYLGREWKFSLNANSRALESAAAALGQLCAPMPGTVVALSVAVGDTVQPGQTLMVIEAMKMEHAIVAPREACVSQVAFGIGDRVEEGQPLIFLE